MDSYKIKLEIFEGPLDLLLHLIRKNKMDIYDIPIAEITKQYLEYIDIMRELDLNIASEFLVMAATLMTLKSRMLLPRPEDVGDDEITVEMLVSQLIEYQKFKEAAEELKEMEDHESLYYPRINFPKEDEDIQPELKVSIFDLLIAVRGMLEQDVEPTISEIEINEIKIEDKINYIQQQIKSHAKLLFTDLFIPQEGRYGVVTTFIALLELLKGGEINAFQTRPFGPIWVNSGETIDENPQVKEN
jgi:segregation and condensation protein A